MENNKHVFPWYWKLADGFPYNGITKHGSTVFSCFACGGGSSMGYKLAAQIANQIYLQWLSKIKTP